MSLAGNTRGQQNYRLDWEELAALDAYWAIVTDPAKKYNQWQDEEFFTTGRTIVEKLFSLLNDLKLKINYDKALDFGCGIGRITSALADYFDQVYGVDISREMIARARKIHHGKAKLIFLENLNNDLRGFDSNQFDLVICLLTLQHLPDREQIKKYLLEFIRVLRVNGFLYFQLPSLPSYSRLKERLLKLRGLIYHLLTSKLKLSKKFCYRFLRLMPFMYMNYIKSSDIREFFSQLGCQVRVNNDHSKNTVYLVARRQEEALANYLL